MSSDKTLIRICNLKTYYPTSKGVVKAVDGIDLRIDEREAVGLAGESGCGKSTVALSLMRLIPPPGRIVDGKVLFEDKDILDFSDQEIRNIRGQCFSMVFQDAMSFLNPLIKIEEQISETIRLHQHIAKKEARIRVIEALEAVSIPSPEKLANCYPHQLSGGMRQRALIAMALSCNPRLIILDEPTTALDVTIQMQILDLIKRIRDNFDMAMLLITHDLSIIAEVCDRVYVMYAGEIVETADVFALFENARHPYTIGLLESSLSVREPKKAFKTIGGTVPDLVNPPLGCRFHPRCKHREKKCQTTKPAPAEIEPNHIVYCWQYN
jgi:oligopeptide/dipeptide ABC transporter ATP-binding protein